MKNIFISSTFRDMHAERDLVQERVLPALRAEARKYGDNVEAIDLRWGVDTSTLETDEGSAKVLTVCLDEIERSHPYIWWIYLNLKASALILMRKRPRP